VCVCVCVCVSEAGIPCIPWCRYRAEALHCVSFFFEIVVKKNYEIARKLCIP